MIIQKFKNYFRKIKDFFRMDSHRHWNVIVHFSFFIILIIICFSIFLLYKIKNDQIIKKSDIKKEPVIFIKEDLLKKIDLYFEEKELKSQDIKNNPFPYGDPGN